MSGLLVSLILLLASAALALSNWRRPALAARLGAWGGALACGVGLAAAVAALFGVDAGSRTWPWVPALGGAFSIGVDSLSALFLIPVFLVCGLGAVYGRAYLKPDESRRATGPAWFFYNLLTASMAVVLTSRNALLFLVSWEVMTLASFFLVTHDHDRAESRRAGRLYLIAAHLGTAFLVGFVLVGRHYAGTLDLTRWAEAFAGVPAARLGLLFVCLVVGFGTKAGFMPLHVWLPEAHPAAPSHVSAVMSGVMIKTGIYGLLRFGLLLGPPPLWWGGLLVTVGVASAVFGILFALAQQDIKRQLAYSSVENMGIVALALGVGFTGRAAGLPLVAVLGFAAALLHVLNHAVFKSLLFFGAGAIYRATHTRNLDELGGLLKRLPRLGLAMIVGAAAISALPPLNGFVGEFLLFRAASLGLNEAAGPAVLLLASIAGLALAGGLAAAAFTRLIGAALLGEPRTRAAAEAVEPARAMVWPVTTLAVLCGALGLFGTWLVAALMPLLALLTGQPECGVAALLVTEAPVLTAVTVMAVMAFALIAVVALVRSAQLRGRSLRSTVTWDCGYARPTARMQYTATSFAHPLVTLFSGVLRSRERYTIAPGLFPDSASLDTHTRDVVRERLFVPAFRLVDRWVSFLKWMQAGRIQLYILYILITLLALLFWTLKGGGA